MSFRKINFKYLSNIVTGSHSVCHGQRRSKYITRFRIPSINKARSRVVVRVNIVTQEDGRQRWKATGKVLVGNLARGGAYTYRVPDGAKMPSMDDRTISITGLASKSKSRKRIFKEAMRLVLDAMWSSRFRSAPGDVETLTANRMYDLAKGVALLGV